MFGTLQEAVLLQLWIISIGSSPPLVEGCFQALPEAARRKAAGEGQAQECPVLARRRALPARKKRDNASRISKTNE
jgi:hypothetical protein